MSHELPLQSTSLSYWPHFLLNVLHSFGLILIHVLAVPLVLDTGSSNLGFKFPVPLHKCFFLRFSPKFYYKIHSLPVFFQVFAKNATYLVKLFLLKIAHNHLYFLSSFFFAFCYSIAFFTSKCDTCI